MTITAGDSTIVSGTLSRSIYDALETAFGVDAGLATARAVVSAALASGIATRANADLIDANVYTPTPTGILNVTSFGGAAANYTDIKGAQRIVTVHGVQEVIVTAAGRVEFDVTLPVASTLGGSYLWGVINVESSAAAFSSGFVWAAPSGTNKARARTSVAAAGLASMLFSFSYPVI